MTLMHKIELPDDMRTALQRVEFIPVHTSEDRAHPLVTRSPEALVESMRDATGYQTWLREHAA